jgi:hypothetical protein
MSSAYYQGMKQLLILASDLVHCAIIKWGHYADQYATWYVQKLAALINAEDTLGEWAQRLDVYRYEERRELFSKIFDDLHLRIAACPENDPPKRAARFAALYEIYSTWYPVDHGHVAMVAKFGRLKCGVVAYDFCGAKGRTICECKGCNP